jgi:hypothetical protein
MATALGNAPTMSELTAVVAGLLGTAGGAFSGLAQLAIP